MTRLPYGQERLGPLERIGGNLSAHLIHELVAAQATSTPDAPALVAGGVEWTYRELLSRATDLAALLRQVGLGPEERAAVAVDRSPEMVAALLAVLMTGGAYVPVDPGYPSERIAFMLEDARARVLVTHRRFLDVLPRGDVPTVCLDDTGCFDDTMTEGAPVPSPACRPENLAYVIYTSGSTGRPKGVAIEHRAAVALIAWAGEVFSPEELQGVLASTSISFDLSVFELFVTLAHGGTVVLAQNALELPSLAARDRVTLVNTVPSALRELLRMDAVPAGVRTINLAGEALPRDLVEDAYRRGAEKVYNLYGPSEDTTYSTWELVPPGEETPPLIGRPVSGTEAHVVDSRLRPSPDDTPGELYLAGLGLARGYLEQPGLTAERFVPDPFASSPGGRLYKTGDLVRVQPDGALAYLGRLDHQVKIRGFRIELGEIEEALRALPEVLDCVVVALTDDDAPPRLAAYLVTSGDVSAIRATLREHLPAHMVPSYFVALEALPLTPNGKVDRKALPRPAPAAGEDVPAAAPRTRVEEVVCDAFADVLGHAVGVDDDFFDHGGHSLLGTRVLSRIRTDLGVELPPQAMFDHPTVAALARHVEDVRRREQDASAPPLVRAERPERLPLSFAQGRLWFLDRLLPGSPLYNEPMRLTLRGPLDEAALAAALAGIVRRHEALRTTFTEDGGVPAQVVHPAPEAALATVDLGGSAAAARSLAEGFARQPFDLERGPLVRALLLRLGPEEHHLLLNVHHVVFDGWSIGVLLDELSVLYAAAVAGRPSPLPELPIQYADFALWQHRAAAGLHERQLAYWRRRLEGLEVLELPTDRPRPAKKSFRGETLRFRWPAELRSRLERFRGDHGATLFMTLLAAFQALLHRLSGQDDVTVGAPIANRNRAEVEGLIGFFVNTLAMRADLAGDPSFTGLLERARGDVLDAYAHQDLPFDKLVEELAPRRDPGQSPLVQVLFTLQNMPLGSRPPGTGLEISFESLSTGTAKFDLILFLEEDGDGGLAGALEVDTDLFDLTTARRLVRHLRHLLEGAARDPEAPLSRLPLLGAAERWQLTGEWNDTRSAYPETTIHALFEARADERPDAPALVFGETTTTYGDLDRAANRLARRLRRLGAGPEAKVVLAAERSPEMVTAILAILKAGAAYVPLDPSYPRERLAFMLDDAGARILVAQEDLLERLPDTAGLEVVRLWDDLAGESDERPAAAAGADHLAYVMYTSGSTGHPKGTAIPHRAVVRLVQDTSFARLDKDEVFLLLAPISFDASTLELWGALTNGARLAVAPPGVLSLEEIGETVRRHGVTTLWLTAGLFHQVVDDGLERLAGVRQLLAGGDVLSPEHVKRVLDELPETTVVNGYGPTENTTFTACAPMHRAADVGAAVSIGRPIAATRVHVVDRHLRPVPIGVPGELLTGGAGLARGYLGRPGLTAERFVPDPNTHGGRLYRTGDVARLLADGRIDFLGRRDNQVKLRGFRIELGEVEAALEGHPGVRGAVVLVREDVPGDRRLVAWVVAPEGGEGLAEWLGERLPRYMVPSVIAAVDAFPLTPNGKVDRRALGRLDLPEPRAGEAGEAPRDPVEEIVAGIWSDVLGLPAVATDDDFFTLGGHSLLATQVASRIRRALDVEPPLHVLFERRTVADLARWVAEERRQGVPVPPIGRAPEDERLELSFAQQRLWFFDRLMPGAAVYNVPLHLGLDGPLDPRVLAAALAEILRRHEALRTTFGTSGDRPVQRIAPPDEAPPLALVDLTGLAPGLRQGAARDLGLREARRGFDLARGPMLRTLLARLADDDHELFVNVHHVAFDGWSEGVLLGELAALYRAFAEGEPSPLPELPVQYADFAAAQRRWLQGEVLESLLEFGRRNVAGLPVLELPTDRPRPKKSSHRGDVFRFCLPVELRHGLEGLGRERGATLFMVLLAAFAALLRRWSGQDDFAIGSPIANRNRAEVEGLIGFFVNTVLMRVPTPGDPSFTDLLADVRETALEAYDHQDLPFEKLVEDVNPDRQSQNPLAQVGFVFQNAPGDTRELAPGLAVTHRYLSSGTSKLDVAFDMWGYEDGLAGNLEYDTELFDETTVGRMVRSFRLLLEGVVRDPGTRLSELPLLAPAERHQLFHEWNDTAAALPADATLARVFAARAAAAPEAPAVVFGDERLTYRDLDRRANRLAHHLRGLGVGADDLVGVMMERGAGLVVSFLATLKAGGAYLPLDPSHPAERRAFMLEDSGARVLVAGHDHLADLDLPGVEVVCPERDLQDLDLPDSPPPDTGDPAGAAYVIYTSGSTGRPKGIVVTQRSVLNLALDDGFTSVRPEHRMAQISNASFDAATWEIWGALCRGACLVGIPRQVTLTPSAFAAELEGRRIDHLIITAALFHQLAQHAPEVLAGLRTVLFGGDRCDPWWVRQAAEALPRGGPTRLLHGYGPTETTTMATWHRVSSVPAGAASVPIGRTVRNASFRVADRGGRPVPVGVPGELWVGGAGVARGYLGRPALTAEQFVPAPDGGRWYKTGDLVRTLADGNLDFLGRIDHQVKLRGFRIELGEVEAALGARPEVQDAVVIVREDRPGDRRMVAYVVAAEDAEPSAAELRRVLGEALPPYMVPGDFVFLGALPITANGKVDRRALPAPERRAEEEEYREPETALQKIAAGTWSQVLDVPRVGLGDNFFALGGHSLLATQAVTRLTDELGFQVSVVLFFESDDLEAFVALLEEKLREDEAGREVLELLSELEGLSEEEAHELLGEGS